MVDAVVHDDLTASWIIEIVDTADSADTSRRCYQFMLFVDDEGLRLVVKGARKQFSVG